MAGEFAPHLGDARGDLVAREDERGVELLAEAELDLERLQLLLDRGARLGFRALGLGGLKRGLGGAVAGDAPRDRDADEGHQAAEQRERQERQPGNDAEHRHQQGGEKQGVGIAAELVEDRLVGRASRAALGDQEAGGERNDQGRNLRDEALADRELGEDVGRRGERERVAGDADHDAAEDVDRENDEAGDRVAAHELRRAVHRAEKRAFLLELAPARLRDLFVDQPGREVGVDRHLLAGNGVEGEAGADFGDARRALGDDEKVDRHQDQEHDDADDEIAAHHQLGETADDVARGGRPLFAAREDEPRRRDVERQPEDRRDQQHRGKGGELQRLLNPQRHHQDQHRKRDRQRQAEVDHRRRHRQEEQAEDQDDADGKGDILAAAAGRRRGRCRRHGHRRLLLRGAPPRRGALVLRAPPKRGAWVGRVSVEPCASLERPPRGLDFQAGFAATTFGGEISPAREVGSLGSAAEKEGACAWPAAGKTLTARRAATRRARVGGQTSAAMAAQSRRDLGRLAAFEIQIQMAAQRFADMRYGHVDKIQQNLITRQLCSLMSLLQFMSDIQQEVRLGGRPFYFLHDNAIIGLQVRNSRFIF